MKFAATILVAEDNLVNQDVVRLMLEACGCKIDLADNGLKAAEAAAHSDYDLILMDCQMPEMDGCQATRLIRENEKTRNTASGSCRHVPIVALTGNAASVDHDRYLAAGMDDCLAKPFNIAQLSEILNRWLAGKAATELGLEQKGAGSPPSSPIDTTLLNSIRSLQRVGAPDILGKVIDHYFCEAPRLIQKLGNAVCAGDPEETRMAAHSLKSCSANLGALRLADICKEIENLGRANSMTRAGEVLVRIEAEFEAVSVALAALKGGDAL